MALSPSFPELISLDLFCTVIELGSLSRAAEAHGVSQPSASARIRKLERQLGVALLHRSPAGSTPTENGLLVAEWAQQLIGLAAHLAAGVEALRADHGGRIRVAASNTVAEFLLPAWLAALRGSHPDSAVDLEVTNSARVIETISAKGADLGFIESPGSTKGLPSADVGNDELVLVVAPDHPWAKRRTQLPIAVLAATPLVSREAGSGTRESLENALEDLHIGRAPYALELGSTTAVKAAIMGHAGPAVLSRLAVDADISAGRLVAVAVAVDLKRRLRAVWPTGHSLDGPAATLLTIARRSKR